MTSQPPVFVFGSNLRGIHGKGAALEAKLKYGAVQGVGRGMTGNAYALPTKRTPHESLSLNEFAANVREFLEYARSVPLVVFHMTPVGTGLAGFTLSQLEEAITRAGGLPGNVLPLWN